MTTFYEQLKIPIKENMDYCLRIDLDEYFYLSDFKNIHEVIDYYSPFDQLNIYWKLFSNSVVLKQVTNNEIWASDQFIPWLHFVPVKEDKEEYRKGIRNCFPTNYPKAN